MSFDFWKRHYNAVQITIRKLNATDATHAGHDVSYIESIVRDALERTNQPVTQAQVDKYIIRTDSENLKYHEWSASQIYPCVGTFIRTHSQQKVVPIEDIVRFLTSREKIPIYIDKKYYKDNDYHAKSVLLAAEYTAFRKLIMNIFYIADKLKNVEKFLIELPWETTYNVGWLEDDFIKNYNIATFLKHYNCCSIGFGSLLNMDIFVARYLYHINDGNKIVFKNVARDRFDNQVEVLLYHPIKGTLFRIIWKLETIKKIVFQNCSKTVRVFFELSDVPNMFIRYATNDTFTAAINGNYGKEYEWKRCKQLFSQSNESANLCDFSDFGASKTVFIEFSNEQPSGKHIYDLFVSLIENSWYLYHSVPPVYATNIHFIFESFKSTFIPLLLDSYPKLSFDLYYSCLTLFSSDMKVMDLFAVERFFEQFFRHICSYESHTMEGKQLNRYINCFTEDILKSMRFNVSKEFAENLKKLEYFSYETTIETCDLIRIAEIRPTYIVYLRPQPILKSRASKLASPDYTLRAKFFDSGGFDFCTGSVSEKEFCIQNILKQITSGLKIRGREYCFFGSSSSQMKESSVTLYATDENGNDSEQLRKLVGTFNRSTSIPKYIAHLGLIFSQSLKIFEIDCPIMVVPDVFGTLKPQSRHDCTLKENYCLSDGIGYFSESICEQFIEELTKVQSLEGYVPSAYQIRYAGFKGMLALNPDAIEEGIYFRQSMRKFDSDNKDVCLLKYAYPRGTMLNRPLIMILDDAHKIEQREFYEIFQQNVHPIAQAFINDINALLFLRLLSQPIVRWDMVHKSYISILEEPFLKSILLHSMLYRLKDDIKLKERLNLSPSMARCAFGVVDETQKLQPGQIFFRATKMNEMKKVFPNETFVVTGKVMVFRNPAMQPGDVRSFEAVDIPELHHIKDCVVFPLKGERSHADELSGGDYDGDEFVIIWNSKLVINNNAKAMDFPYGQAVKGSASEFTTENMIKFFGKYFLSQSMGLQATLHLKMADYHSSGLNSSECEELAYSYNIMLDSAKTGYFNISNKKIFFKHDPDFMTYSFRKPQYLSQKILGQFFRQCTFLEQIIRIANSSLDINNQKSKLFRDEESNYSLPSNRLTLPGWEHYRESAHEALEQYKTNISRILGQTKINHEAVLFSDCFNNRDDYLKYELTNLKSEFTKLYHKQVQQLGLNETRQHWLTSAWYTICVEEIQTIKDNPVLGLPWLILEQLCALSKFVRDREIVEKKFDYDLKATINDDQNLVLEKIENLDYGSNSKGVESDYRLWHDLRELSFKSWQIRKDYSLTIFWYPLSIEESFDDSTKIQEFRQSVDRTTLMIVFNLIKNIFRKIRNEIYKTSDKYEIFWNGRFVDENSLIADIVWDILQKLITDQLPGEKIHDRYRVTVSTLLNTFFLYLYNLACNVNFLLDDLKNSKDSLADLFLLKYSVFSLVFINKVNENHDKKFAEIISTDFFLIYFDRSLSFQLKNLYKFDEDKGLKQGLTMFQDILDDCYNSEVKGNSVCLKKNTERFGVNDLRVFKKEHWQNILKFLSGCENIKTIGSSYLNQNTHTNVKTDTITYCTLNNMDFVINNLHVSNALCRLFLGHPRFYETHFPIIKKVH